MEEAQAPLAPPLATLLRLVTSIQLLWLSDHIAVPSLQGVVPTPLITTCAAPFWFIQNTFLKHHLRTRQQAMIEKRMITFKRNSRLSFLYSLRNCWPPTAAVHKCDAIIRLITRLHAGSWPEIRNGGLFGGSGSEALSYQRQGIWGQSPQPPDARGSGGGAPSARKFCIFLQKQLNFRPILIKK